MELIRLIINSVKNEICFLCFKESDKMQNIHVKLDIEGRLFKENLSIADIINNLFPIFGLTLNKSCQDCTELLIRMYVAIHTNNIMKKIINRLVSAFNNELNKSHLSNLDGFVSYPININLNSIMDVKRLHVEKHDVNTISVKNDESVSNTPVEEDVSREKQCTHCYKMFDSVKQYKNHIKNHSRKRKKVYHNCKQCNYKSLCKESLQGHINKNHLKMRPYVCKICYKNFYHKKNLVEHEIRHAPVRNDICEICGDSFIHKKNLLEHLKLHTGEKPYLCTICGKRFITSGRRLEHIKRCHSEKNERCLLCDKKFSLVKELTRHMKHVHS